MKVQGFADRDDLRLQCWRGFQKTCSPLGCRQVIVFFFPASVSQTSPYALQGGKTKRETKKKPQPFSGNSRFCILVTLCTKEAEG